MVIRGNSRGNGRQLADYLLTKKDNDRVWIFAVDGHENPEREDLRNTLFDMDVTAELTKGKKGLYHAQINPDEKASQRMTDKDWEQAADILGKHLGYDGQRRTIVMHEKKGRIHAHIVWERYDHERGVLKPDSFNFAAQDKARQQMEHLFGHKVTPKRNKHRPELKKELTDVWNKTASGKDFINAVHERGFILAQGTPRHPFMVVDKEARSFDLVRQLNGVWIKEVRQRMRGIDLLDEKQAIEQMKKRSESTVETGFIIVNSDNDAVKKEKLAEQFRKSKADALNIEEEYNHKKSNYMNEENIKGKALRDWANARRQHNVQQEEKRQEQEIKQEQKPDQPTPEQITGNGQKTREKKKQNFEMTKEEITAKREAFLNKMRENSGQITKQPKPETGKKRGINYERD